jgi:hypothetical protein
MTPGTSRHRFLIIADGQFGPLTSKTANSCIRYFPERILGVFDRAQAGKTVQEVLGFGGAIPVIGDFERGLALGRGATAVLVGIAPMGGKLPPEWRGWLRQAIGAALRFGAACIPSSPTIRSWGCSPRRTASGSSTPANRRPTCRSPMGGPRKWTPT